MTISSSITPQSAKEIKSKAWDLGFDHVAFTTPEIPEIDQKAYLSWCAAGLAGDMAYMTRDPQKRIHVKSYYPNVKSVITLGLSYYQGKLPEKPGPGFGRVARYAWGLDYHDVILGRLQILMTELKNGALPAIDTKPILERALASKAGLGFVGKNTVLISPRSMEPGGASFHVGSFIFLTELLLTIPLAPELGQTKIPNGCGSCTKCISACPTQAFEGPYQLKADKCISFLTIENKGWIPHEVRSQIGDWVFGCDICQDVCPYNATAFETRWPEFNQDKGVGAWVSLKDIFSVETKQEFKKKWGSTPLSRSKRKGLIRNACVVAGNSCDESLIPDLKKLLEDEEPMVRGHALWALSKLEGSRKIKRICEQLVKSDSSDDVVKESKYILDR